jgi:hypothetical protein
MGSILALIKRLLAKTDQVPFSDDPSRHILVGEDLVDGHLIAGVLKETWDNLPQILRVTDRVGQFLEIRAKLHTACCGSPLASRLMREMEFAEANLESAYNELLYPQKDYTPYQTPTEAP